MSVIPEKEAILEQQVAVSQREYAALRDVFYSEYSEMHNTIGSLELKVVELEKQLRKAEAMVRRSSRPRKVSHKVVRRLMMSSAELYNEQFRKRLGEFLSYAVATSDVGLAWKTFLGLWVKKLSVNEIFEFVFGLFVNMDKLCVTTERLVELSNQTAFVTTPEEATEILESHRRILLSK